MNRFGILATLQARAGKEAEVEKFLRSARPLVEAETGTTAWFAFKIGPATFASLTRSGMRKGGVCTSTVQLLRRSSPRPRSSLLRLHRFRPRISSPRSSRSDSAVLVPSVLRRPMKYAIQTVVV